MNGEIPSVPITTLAGISSLTDLLGELPLPTPLASTVNNKSLLYHPKVAEDARQLLGSNNQSLVSQLSRALKKTSTDHIELKDNLAGDSIEGDVPELLRAILSSEPNVFKSSRLCRNADGGINSTGGNQHFNQQPSPYQAGQISPCPPGSPARFPPQPGSSPSRYSGQTSLYGPIAGQSSNQYQMQFLNFASPDKQDGPTINGGFSGSPANQNGTTPPYPRGRSSSRHKSATVSSPAQAAAAPITVDLASTHHGHYDEMGRRRSSKSGEPIVLLEPLSSEAKAPPTLQPSIKLLRLDSTLSEVDIHREDARYLVRSTDDVDQLTIRVGKNRPKEDNRRGRKRLLDSDDDDYHPDQWSESVVIKKKKKKKKLNDSVLSTEELMETPTFRKFFAIVEGVLESSEDIDLGALVADDDDDDVGGTSEAIITKSTLNDLCNESAKLKSMGVMNQIPYEKLVRLLAILHWNIKDGCRAFPALTEEDHDDDSISRELALERVVTAIDAGLAALNIMTAPNMPKQVYVEDVIDRIVTLVKSQTQNTIFPEFDPVYRVDPKNKSGYSGNLKMKRARSHGAKHKSTITLYNKISEMVGCLAELVSIQELTDTIILQTSTLAVSPFFVENISELQLNALKLVTSVFSRYEKHRQLILEDILSSLARLPSSKKNLRNYRLNSDEHIQMVTALALELIQCVVRLPEQDNDKDPELPEGNQNKRDAIDVDDEVIIVTSYETAMRTAHNFLAVFLRKCATKGEEDYRPLFENFVYDLLSTVNKPEWPAAELLLSLLGRLLVQQFSNKSVDMSLRVASLDYLGIVAARLRKDAVTSKLNEDVIDEIIAHINEDSDEESTESDSESSKKGKKKKVPTATLR